VRSATRRRRWLVSGLIGIAVLACGLTAAALLRGGATSDPPGSSDRGEITASRFELVRPGMSRGQVVALLGPPASRARSLAEGLAWPEPEESCWDYGSTSDALAFQVCFVDGRLISASAFPIEGEGS
jgi:hypothetical protein